MAVTMKGRRREDTRLGYLPEDLQPGDYWLYTNDAGEPIVVDDVPDNLTKHMGGFVAPTAKQVGADPDRWWIGIGTLRLHTIRIEEDGTWSIRHMDGSSNSIHFDPGGEMDWHGFMEHGEWRPV